MTKIIVTLTTIPARAAHIGPVVDSIWAQTRRPDAVQLYVPREYRRRSLGALDPSSLAANCDVIMTDEDFGPATKVLPAARRYRGQDVTLIYCDDDRIYHPQWIERLTACAARHPDAAIAEERTTIHRIFGRMHRQDHGVAYRLKRAASLGLWKPTGLGGRVTVDVAMGFGGVLVRPDWFDDAAFDIPDVGWAVDDVWLSGMLANRGVPIRWTARTDDEQSRAADDVGGITALTDNQFDGLARREGEFACARHLIQNFGVWPDHARRFGLRPS